MIAIFTALGLVLFGGGIYAIYDGWPYLVLERGFTEVIIGAIASTAGLILLSLAWVLRELRAVRQALETAQLPREDAPAVDWPRRAPVPAPVARSEDMQPRSPSLAPSLGSAAISAAAGAAAASVVSDALAASEAEAAPAAPQPSATPERDLFGKLVAERFRDEESHAEAEHKPEVAAEPLPDMFELPSFEEDEPKDAPIAIETESHEPDEIVAAKVVHAGEAVSMQHEPSPEEIAPTTAEPEAPAIAEAAAEERETRIADVDLDEFSALRESLAGHLGEPAGSARIEPSLATETDPFAEVESWMDRASPRREPWFEAPDVSEAAAPEPVSPPWPPRTEAPAFGDEEEPVAEPAASERPAEEAAPDTEEETADAAPEAAEEIAAEAQHGAPEDEAPPEPPPAASAAERPASDEGVVGAYQVGDAHFTIYADGSIRARTPDGEYSFASMDELKVYLASEKSRLGA